MRKLLLISILLIISQLVLLAQQSKKPFYESEKYKRFYELSKDAKYLGVALAQPSLKDGWQATAPWLGVNVNMWETMNFYWFRGEAEKMNDAGSMLRGIGYMGGYGTQIPIVITANKNFNFFPYIGVEANWKYFQDYSKVDDMDNVWGEGQQIGFGLNPGLSLRFGPVQLRAQYHLSAGYSFNKSNAFSTFTAFPSISISVSALSLLLNPREFSATGLKHYVENYQQSSYSYISDSKVTGNTVTQTKTTVTHSSWTDTWRERTFSVMDVRPFIFIGPRLGSSFYLNKDFSATPFVGANIGFKGGHLWMNGSFEYGSLAFHNPKDLEQLYFQYGSSIPKLSGKFKGSSRYGAQLGIDAVVFFQKSDFVPYDAALQHKIKTATSYYSVIPFIGFGKVNFGDFEWDSPTGAADFQDYTSREVNYITPESVIKKQTYFSYGVELNVGAMALGFTKYNYLSNKKQPQLNDWEVHMSWDIPVIRMANSMKVVHMNNKLNKQNKKQKK